MVRLALLLACLGLFCGDFFGVHFLDVYVDLLEQFLLASRLLDLVSLVRYVTLLDHLHFVLLAFPFVPRSPVRGAVSLLLPGRFLLLMEYQFFPLGVLLVVLVNRWVHEADVHLLER